MKNAAPFLLLLFVFEIFPCGCTRHQARPGITAVGLSRANRGEPAGIPYYLPKPLLVVAKNVRHIDESKVGLSGPAPIPGGFDNQAAYADIKANVTVPGSDTTGKQAAKTPPLNQPDAAQMKAMLAKDQDKSFVGETMTPGESTPDDGLQPDSFYTYQIVFVPDLTQKYGLRISGGAGEIRAAMNMVNGWMYTGMGPYYFKDSSSAQNVMATGAAAMYAGRGVSSVLDSVGNLATTIGAAAAGKESGLSNAELLELNEQINVLQSLAVSTPKIPQSMLNYAEIYVYEPALLGGQTQWNLVAEHHFTREYLTDTDAGRKARQEMFEMIVRKAAGPATPPSTVPSTNQPSDAQKIPQVPTVPPAGPIGGSGPEHVPAPRAEQSNKTSRRTNSPPHNSRDVGNLDLTSRGG